LSRAEQRALPFLDKWCVDPRSRFAEVPLSQLPGAWPQPDEECHFIFHSAFCCSTLLGRALDVDGLAKVLLEPQALVDLAAAPGTPDGHEDPKAALGAILGLLQRPHRSGEATIIKPSNFANTLIDDLLALRPRANAVLMYVSLPSFLLAIVRRGASNRSWAREMASLFRRHPQFEALVARDLLLLTDLQVAALVWLHHQSQFARLVLEQPAGRIATVEASAFLAEPTRTLREVSALFRLDMDETRAEALATGTAFQYHAKRPGRAFDPAVRRREEAVATFAYGSEIEIAVDWARELAGQVGVPMHLEAPLLCG
jgi:hypothetical protein